MPLEIKKPNKTIIRTLLLGGGFNFTPLEGMQSAYSMPNRLSDEREGVDRYGTTIIT